jgi:hypothetical protein
MRLLFATLVAAISLTFATGAIAQSTPQPAPDTSAPTASTPTAPAPAVTAPAPTYPTAPPAANSKRFACRTAALTMRGQEGRDQLQLCMAQARLDCLKQAIDQRIVGPQRKEFVKSCVQ